MFMSCKKKKIIALSTVPTFTGICIAWRFYSMGGGESKSRSRFSHTDRALEPQSLGKSY